MKTKSKKCSCRKKFGAKVRYCTKNNKHKGDHETLVKGRVVTWKRGKKLSK